MGGWGIGNHVHLHHLADIAVGFDYTLGWLAGLLGVFAGFALFPTLARVRTARTPGSRWAWLLGGATAMGLGFWGCHNMALLGLDLQTYYVFNPTPGFLAFLPVIAGCAISIKVLASPLPSLARLNLGALSLSLGNLLTHLTLMAAIVGDLIMVHEADLLARSLVLGYGFALAALYVNRSAGQASQQSRWRWLAGSVLLGVTALGVHFSAMAASYFHDNPAIDSAIVSTPPTIAILLIAGVVLLFVTVFWIGALIDGRLGEASESLRNSEARNRAVIETMLDAHMVTDTQGIVRSFNPAAERIFGWSAQEIIGRTVQELISKTDPERDRDWVTRNAHTAALPEHRRRWVYPEGGRRRDGSTFPVEMAVNPFGANGQQFFSCVVRDLSESWKTEARLQRLAAAIEQAADAIVILDAERRIEYVNPQYERLTGYTADQVVGRSPTDGANHASVYAEIWDTVRQGRKWTGQVRSQRQNGKLCDEELTVAPVCDKDGEIVAYVAVMRDISERIQAETERRRLAEALQHCSDSIEVLDSQGRIVYVNAAYENSHDQRLADIRGSRPEALLDFGMSSQNYEEMLHAAYHNGQPWSGTLKSITMSGKIREEDVTVTPLRGDAGAVTGYVVVKRDTTLRRHMEAQEQQRQKIESMGQLADGIAHELQRPMQQLGDNLRFLRDSFVHLDRLLSDLTTLAEGREPLAPSALAGVLQFADVDFLRREVGQALAQSSVGVQQMTDIVQATRAISGAGAGQSLVDLNRAIQSTVTVSSGEWRQVAEVRTLFDTGLPAIKCVPADISLVVLNLLVICAQELARTNPSGIRGKGLITVSTRPFHQWAEIRIQRSGAPMTPEARRQLFGPEAGDPAAPSDPAMALAHDIIVRRHGGSIALESEPGRGTSFVIRLPIGSEADTATTAAA